MAVASPPSLERAVDAYLTFLTVERGLAAATIRAYRVRVQQCEMLHEYAIAEDIREILRQEQEHQIDLATALGENVPSMEEPAEKPVKK